MVRKRSTIAFGEVPCRPRRRCRPCWTWRVMISMPGCQVVDVAGRQPMPAPSVLAERVGEQQQEDQRQSPRLLNVMLGVTDGVHQGCGATGCGESAEGVVRWRSSSLPVIGVLRFSRVGAGGTGPVRAREDVVEGRGVCTVRAAGWRWARSSRSSRRAPARLTPPSLGTWEGEFFPSSRWCSPSVRAGQVEFGGVGEAAG